MNNDIAVLDLTTRRHQVLFRGILAKYSASGHILYVTSAGILMAVPFDADRLKVGIAGLEPTPMVNFDGIAIARPHAGK